MGRDIHYCECGEEIFDEMETCWKCDRKTERGATSELRIIDWLDANPSVAAEASSVVRKWCMENLAEMRAENRCSYYERVGILYDFYTDCLFKASQEQRRHPASSGAHEPPDEAKPR